MKVGDQVWIRTGRRVYPHRDAKGYTGRTLPRGSWEKRWIIGETRVSWILGYENVQPIVKGPARYGQTKIKKKQARKYIAGTREEIEFRIWLTHESHRIATKISRIAHDSPRMMLKFMDLIGEKVPEFDTETPYDELLQRERKAGDDD